MSGVVVDSRAEPFARLLHLADLIHTRSLPPFIYAEHHYHIHNDAGVLTGTIVLGRVRLFHVRDDLIDAESLLVDTDKLQPVSRLGGITYGRTTQVYEAPRPVWEKETEREGVKEALETGEVQGKAKA